MLNLENAKKLKSAGLVWKLKEGDWYWANGHVLYDGEYPQLINNERHIFLPSLSQLLDEIEKLGYSWEMGLTTTKGGPMMPGEWKSWYWVEIFKNNKSVYSAEAGTPDDAAGLNLLWILERGKNG